MARDADWQAIPEVTDEAWNRSVKRLFDAQTALKAEFAKRTDEELERPLAGGKNPLFNFERTRRDL